MGITLGSNFDGETGLPLDSRLVVSGLIQRDGIDSLKRYEGMIVYVESEAKNYQLVGGISNTDWAELSSGGSGGSGVKNFITSENSSLEDAINDWTTYNDSGSFVDGTGGVSGLTISITSDTSEVLDGVGSLKIFKPSLDCEGNGAVIEFDIPRGYRGKLSQISFLVDGTAQTGNDFEVRAYDVTNSKEIYCGTDDEIEIPKEVGEIKLPFQADSSCKTARLCFNCKDSNTDSYSIFIDEVKVSPMTSVSVESTSDWDNFTGFTIGAWSASVATSGRIKRNGDNADIQISMEITGAVSGTPYITLNDLTVDSTKLSATANSAFAAGYATVLDAATTVWVGVVNYSPANGRFYIYTGRTTGRDDAINNTNPFTFAGSDIITVRLSVPIVEWANSRQVLNEYQLSQQTIKAKYRLNGSTSNSSINNASSETMDYNFKVYDSHNCVTTGASWSFASPRNAYYRVTAKATTDSSTAWAENEVFTITARVDASNDIELGRSVGKDFSSGGNFNSVSGSGTVYIPKDKVLDVQVYQSSGAAINLVTGDSTLSWITIEEIPDFTMFGAVKSYEVIQDSSNTSTSWPFSAGAWGDITSISVPSGVWDIRTNLMGQNMAAVSSGNVFVGASTVSGNVPVDSYNSGVYFNDGTNGARGSMQSVQRFTFTETTTVYLKAVKENSTANFNYRGWTIEANRIK